MNRTDRPILLRVTTLSVVIVSLLSFIGPYDYQFESGWALTYYYVGLVCFIFPLWFISLGDKHGPKSVKSVTPSPFVMRLVGEKFLVTCMLVAIGASAVFAYEVVRIFSWESILHGGDYRAQFSDYRSNTSRFAEIASCLGPAAYLVGSVIDKPRLRLLRPLSYAALMCMGLTGILLGARWKLFVCLLILVFSLRDRRPSRSSNHHGSARTLLRWTAVSCVVGATGYLFYRLFAIRGLLSAKDQWRFYPGDMPLRPWALHMYEVTDGAVQPLYRAVDYIAQSPFVFSFVYEHYLPSNLYFGAFFGRVLSFVLPPIGVPFPSYSSIVDATFGGMYSGSLYGLIVDVGVPFAPIVMLATGIGFGAIESRRRISRFCRATYPMVCAMAACSPIYYLFHVGYVDFIFFWLLVLFTVFKLGGAWGGTSDSSVKTTRPRMGSMV